MDDNCFQTSCVDNIERSFNSKWVTGSGCAVRTGKVKGKASSGGYPGWNERNAFAEAQKIAARRSQVSWDSWYSNDAGCFGNNGWSHWTEYKAIDWYQQTAFYTGDGSDGKACWIAQGYTKSWYWAEVGNSYSHGLCNEIVGWLGGLASEYTAGISNYIGGLVSTNC